MNLCDPVTACISDKQLYGVGVYSAGLVSTTPPPLLLKSPLHTARCGPGSVVGIATGYGLDGPGIESRWGARFSAPVQTGPGAHPASCTMGTGSFQVVKSGRGVTLTPHPLLVPWSRKSRAILLLSPMSHTACTEPQCLYPYPYLTRCAFVPSRAEAIILYRSVPERLTIQ